MFFYLFLMAVLCLHVCLVETLQFWDRLWEGAREIGVIVVFLPSSITLAALFQIDLPEVQSLFSIYQI